MHKQIEGPALLARDHILSSPCQFILPEDPADAGDIRAFFGPAHLYQIPGAAEKPGGAAALCLFLPKSKRFAAYLMAEAAAALPPGTPFHIVGDNRSGMKSIAPQVEALIGPITARQIGHHATLLTASPHPACAAARTQTLSLAATTYTVTAWGQGAKVTTLPGVFSDGGLDEGTAFLLDNFSLPPAKSVLDWGCGAGVIGTLAALALPEATVDLVDINPMAIAASIATRTANGLSPDRVRVFPSNGLAAVTGRYDLILTNPPFHAGQAVDMTATQNFFASTPRHLTPTGQLVIVANRFLNYLPILQTLFRKVSIPAETPKFRIIIATP
jgi:16S rRNA (guanine1207-N2)-methyltransferase